MSTTRGSAIGSISSSGPIAAAVRASGHSIMTISAEVPIAAMSWPGVPARSDSVAALQARQDSTHGLVSPPIKGEAIRLFRRLDAIIVDREC